MQFEFVSQQDMPLLIVTASLLECDQADCQDAQPLAEVGPQRFTCSETSCQALAYGFKPYHRLRITFSDGVIRESNVFTKRSFAARYRVEIHSADLSVQERLGGLNSIPLIFSVSVVGAICLSGLLFAVFILLILFIVREDQGKNTFAQSRPFYLLAWLIAVPLIGAGTAFDITLPLTIVVECLAILFYTKLRNKPSLKGFTAVLLMNLLTQPPLWYALNSTVAHQSWLVMGIVEIFIWLFESVLFYLTQRKSYPFWEAISVGLLLNVISLTIGLLLPV